MAAGKFRFLTDPEYVLTLLINRIQGGSRPVFLLGAGCSKQYGLPSFRELLLDLWEDHLHYSGTARSTEELREGLEKLWQAFGPEDREKVLKGYLGGMQGTACPGYLRLARLAAGGHVKAIVNMNFDTLLEEALTSLHVPYLVVTSFRVPAEKTLVVYKPHGSIGKVEDLTHLISGRAVRASNDLILDIAKGDLFADPEEQEKAQELLTESNVVALGYSGVDAKIDAVLLGVPKKGDRRDFKLFIANVASPDPRLVMAQEERGSRNLSILGEEGGFESFMEELEKALDKPPGRRIAEEPPNESAVWGSWEASTRTEKAALGQCIKLAQILGSGLTVQERSDIDLEKHGLQVYFHCRELARLTGIRLTSPEKHVLQCAALLHDLGQLAVDRVEAGGDNPGWKLLEDHGQVTAALLERRVPRGSALRKSLVPSSYGKARREKAVEVILESILLLCRRHAADSPAPAEEVGMEEVTIGGWPVPLRKGILLPLFALAEELVEAQPMPNSPDVYLDGPALTENPAHNLSLRWRPGSLKISFARRMFLCAPGDDVPLPIAWWFMARILSFLARFNDAVRNEGGQCLEPEASEGPIAQSEGGSNLLAKALAETLVKSANRVERGSVGELPALLDLLSIYTLRVRPGQSWLPVESAAVGTVLDRVRPLEGASSRNLLQLYFPACRKEAPTSLEKAFVAGFRDVIYPSWRFVARRWRSGTSIIPLATSCLDMGASWFRAEALEGIPHLLKEHVDWSDDGKAYAHDQCTLCTSRLLAAFSNARLLFSRETLEKLSPNPGRGLDQAVAGFLQHFLRWPPDSRAWWGFGGEESFTGLQAPEYLAWPARALVRCLAADEVISSHSGVTTRWLEDLCGIKRGEVIRLLQERWKALLEVQPKELLSSSVEDNRILALGQVAGAYLELETCPEEIRDLALNSGRASKFIENLEEVFKELAAPTTVERLPLIPVRLVIDSVRPDEKSARDLVEIYRTSIASPAWVKNGPDAGSWGFDSRYTESILEALVAFWRHAFLPEHRERFEAAFQAAM